MKFFHVFFSRQRLFRCDQSRSFMEKLTTRVRSTVPSFFFGRGDDLLMPRSTASSNCGTPLLLVRRTDRISPVGSCSTLNTAFGLPGTSVLPVKFVLLLMMAVSLP